MRILDRSRSIVQEQNYRIYLPLYLFRQIRGVWVLLTMRVPLRSFFRDHLKYSFGLSPDGKTLSFLKSWRRHSNLFIQTGPRGEWRQVTKKRQDVSDYLWKSDRYLIYQLDSQLGCLDLRNDKVRDVTLVRNAKEINVIDALENISADEILIKLARAKGNLSDVYRLNVSSTKRKMRMVAQHPDPRKFGVVQQWVANNQGEICAAISVKGTNHCLLTRPDEKSQFKIARTMDFRRSIDDQFWQFLCYTQDNRGIYAISRIRRGRDKVAAVVLSPSTGREIRRLYHNPRVDLASFAFSQQRKLVTHVSFYNSKLQYKVLDRQTAPVFRTLARKLSGYVVEIMANNRAETKFIVLARSDRMPGKWYLLDSSNLRKHRLILLHRVAPWLKQKDLARVSPIKIKARDGLTIHGYLTLPRARKRKDLPLVLNVHGGPENRNYWHYDTMYGAEVQFLANRGYAVLQLNFRGSIGYGRSFWKKGFRQHGRKMQNDLTDGVRGLINRGIADPKRIAIYGKSYGGYAALAGITFPPKLYRAAISYAGVSNWLTWLEWLKAKSPNDPFLPQEYTKTGHPRRDRKRLEAIAPALHADRITKPLLIAHAEQDKQVPKSESDQMVAALGGKDFRYMIIRNDGHILRNERNRIRFYTAVEAFLAKHLS